MIPRTEWVERALQAAPRVAFLLRSTILGGANRTKWWKKHRPGKIWTLDRRPLWGGPGARKTTDTVPSVLVYWNRKGADITEFDWIQW